MTKLNRVDIMVDIETLGTKSDSTIFQISAIAFNIQTGEQYYEFNRIADITLNKTMNVDGSTLKWWLNTNAMLLTDLINLGELSSDDTLRAFHQWLFTIVYSLSEDHRNVYLWGNGILFDNKMIQTQFEAINLLYPIFYRNDRDVRTIVELASNKLGITEGELKSSIDRTGVAHNAFDDVKFQIDLVVECHKILVPPSKKDSLKWYSYTNPLGGEVKFKERNAELEKAGWVLQSITDCYVDAKAMKVGGK